MARLNAAIPSRSFEIIRDRILEILIDEITNQQEITYDNTSINFVLERSKNISVEEMPLINVSLGRGDFSNKNTITTDGAYVFNIDVHVAADASPGYEDADTVASLDMQTLIGKCMAILENPAYKTLGFVAGFIGNVMAIDLNFAEAGKQDMKSTAMGRLQIAVKANEVTELITPALIEGYETRITLSDSNKGYKYTNT
jgi:hypothetical protein